MKKKGKIKMEYSTGIHHSFGVSGFLDNFFTGAFTTRIFFFYENAVKQYPSVANRFLFMSGDLSPERKAFLEAKGISYLPKPMEIKKIRDAATRILMLK